MAAYNNFVPLTQFNHITPDHVQEQVLNDIPAGTPNDQVISHVAQNLTRLLQTHPHFEMLLSLPTKRALSVVT